jgi:A/G-specific adenine glycosylase
MPMQSAIQVPLLNWFKNNKHKLPWRENRTWYTVWISEVMLQQTQVSQVIPYYHRFLKRFPSVDLLAAAPQEALLKLWEGLGYYSRARNLHKAAKLIVHDFKGQLPDTKEDLERLPGFGVYTSHAILSLAFNKPYAVIDGNVIRVITRLYAIESDIRLRPTRREIETKVDELLDRSSPANFNEAIMELGATLCKPVNPSCQICPLRKKCIAKLETKIEGLPFKSKPLSKPHYKAYTYIIEYKGKFLLTKRPQNGLLAGMWEFPFSEFIKHTNDTNESAYFLDKLGIHGMYIRDWSEIKHSYTHFNLSLTTSYWQVSSSHFNSNFYEHYRWVRWEKILLLPLHKAMMKVLLLVGPDLKIIS